MTDRCERGGCDFVGLHNLPRVVVRSHVADLRPIFVRLCLGCIKRAVDGGALVERDIIGNAPSWVMAQLNRMLGCELQETQHYQRLMERRP